MDTCQDPDFQPEAYSRRQFLRKFWIGFGALGSISLFGPGAAGSEEKHIDRLMRESEDRLMKAIKREMIERGEEISATSLKAQGWPDDLVTRFLAIEVGPPEPWEIDC